MRITINILIMIIFISLMGCTLEAVDTEEAGNRDSDKSWVLIATQSSKFKRSLVSEIKDTLKKNNCYVKVVDVRGLNDISTLEYNAVVILNRCMAGRPDPRVESFIDTTEQKDKVILLTTGQLDSWKPDSKEVDAMTSASTMSESAKIAQTIAGKVLMLLDTQKSS